MLTTIAVNTAFSGVIWFVADALAQTIEITFRRRDMRKHRDRIRRERDKEKDSEHSGSARSASYSVYAAEADECRQQFSWRRALKMTVIGGITAVELTLYYHFVFTLFWNPGNKMVSSIVMTTFDLIVFAPIHSAFLLFLSGFGNHLDVDEGVYNVYMEFKNTWLAWLVFWTPIELLQYIVIPREWTVFFVRIVDILGLPFLAWLSNRSVNQALIPIGDPHGNHPQRGAPHVQVGHPEEPPRGGLMKWCFGSPSASEDRASLSEEGGFHGEGPFPVPSASLRVDENREKEREAKKSRRICRVSPDCLGHCIVM
eukprot:NODE_2824_length_1033_cov_11.316057_g2363_i0.p1 GENE.NODE_2824_length_1033_cov_11.316057_g2363_i0~~NODE_2824_length_1033_cov_11.316057_g2363_i0.p1  ORF type:complete len:313 (-),score=36.94 NODE_2824_length_1033_cov_11.316057_g2363_i0:18-956(-)